VRGPPEQPSKDGPDEVEQRQLQGVGHAFRAPDIVPGQESVGDRLRRAFKGSFISHDEDNMDGTVLGQGHFSLDKKFFVVAISKGQSARRRLLVSPSATRHGFTKR
jgi:hypothetical protein